jgi:hypothetical protein
LYPTIEPASSNKTYNWLIGSKQRYLRASTIEVWLISTEIGKSHSAPEAGSSVSAKATCFKARC